MKQVPLASLVLNKTQSAGTRWFFSISTKSPTRKRDDGMLRKGGMPAAASVSIRREGEEEVWCETLLAGEAVASKIWYRVELAAESRW